MLTAMPRRNRLAAIGPASTPTTASSAMSPATRLDSLARSVFNNAVVHAPHLKPSDTTLLTAYALVASRVLRDKVASAPDVSSLIRLARQLRLTSMATTDPRTAYRRKVGARPSALAEYLRNNPDDDDEDDDTR